MLPRAQQVIGRRGVAGAILLIALLAAAFYLGSTRPTLAMHTAVPSSAQGAISIEADGWTYSVPLDGVEWIDVGGWHESGRPSCLPPEGTTRAVTFASVQVSAEGSTWRPVVWVDCR